MSGVEVVIGLVLGAMPLAVSICEHLRGVADKCGRLANFEKQYRKTYGDLKDEQVIFRLQVEKLITPLVNADLIEESLLEEVIENSKHALWTDPNISKAIKGRLGRTYDSYLRVLEDTERECLELLKSLGFDKPSIVSTDHLCKLAVYLHCNKR